MPDEPQDPLPAMMAALDQLRMEAPQIACVYRTYFDAFKSQGFRDAQACYLAAAQTLQNPGTAP